MMTLPDVCSTKGDASVRFAYDAHRRWYVLRTTYDREESVADQLIRVGIYAYVARRYQPRKGPDEATVSLKSLMPNILFAYLTAQEAAALMDERPQSPSRCPQLTKRASFLYVRHDEANPEQPMPLTIDDSAMRNFILTTATCSEHVLMLSRDAFKVEGNGRYLVTDGPFMGVVGKQVRAYRQLRILVELEHLAYLCTPHIPAHCLQQVYE